MLRQGDTGDWIGTFLGHKGAVWGATLNKEATKAATAAADFTAKVWDAVTGDELLTLAHKHIVKSVNFTQDSGYLLTGGQDKILRIYDLCKPEADPQEISGHTSAIKKALWYSDDKQILSAADDKTVRLWDRASMDVVKTLQFDTSVSSMEYIPDGEILIITYGKTVAFYNALGLDLIKTVDAPAPINSASLHPDKDFFVAGGDDFKLYKYDYNTKEELESYKGHFGPVHCVRFSPDGELYASGSEDGTLRLWQTAVGKTYGLWKCVLPDLEWIAKVKVNHPAVLRRAQQIQSRRAVKKEWQAAWLLRAVTCIDLTTLSGDDSPSNVYRLCFKAKHPIREDLLKSMNMHNKGITTAAVCVYPSRVSDAVNALEAAKCCIPVASVATGFPAGQTPLKARLEEIRVAVENGAREIDVVINRTLALTGQWEELYKEICQFREACGEAHLKTILAVGELGSFTNIYKASLVSMMAGVMDGFVFIVEGIEHVWDLLDRRVSARAIPPRNVQKLAGALVEKLGNISQQELTNLVQSMRMRCTAVLQAAGGHTRY
ncbi:STRAP protein, partial [Polypterus senegalus]